MQTTADIWAWRSLHPVASAMDNRCTDLGQFGPAIRGVLDRNRNCNAVFVYWPVSKPRPNGGAVAGMHYESFVAKNPLVQIGNLDTLIRPERYAYLIPELRFTFM
jgi:hypothetical protein